MEAIIQSAKQWHKHKLVVLQYKEIKIICIQQWRKLTQIRDFNSNTLFSLVDDFKIHERHLKKKKIEEKY